VPVLGPIDYAIWFLSFGAEVYVVVFALAKRHYRRYFSLASYMLVAALVNVSHFIVYWRYGFESLEYRYVYYYSDCLVTILLYFTILELYQHTFQEMAVSRHLRIVAVLLLGGTAWFSYMVVHNNLNQLTSRFVVELGQNLYFVGVVLTYVLWGAVLKLRETRTRLVHLVLSLGIYFSANAVLFALRNLFPEIGIFRFVFPLVATFLPLAWAYTFTRIPEEARLAPARVATAHR
jgi:hypothetical protein